MKYGDDRSDPYLDKETGILRNRLGLRTQAALDRAESTMSFLRTVELHEHPVKGSFDLAPLRRSTSDGSTTSMTGPAKSVKSKSKRVTRFSRAAG
jgi:hypothetical protein